MNIPFKLGFRCADQLLPLISSNERLLHLLKGYALTYRNYEMFKAYSVNGHVEFGIFKP